MSNDPRCRHRPRLTPHALMRFEREARVLPRSTKILTSVRAQSADRCVRHAKRARNVHEDNCQGAKKVTK